MEILNYTTKEKSSYPTSDSFSVGNHASNFKEKIENFKKAPPHLPPTIPTNLSATPIMSLEPKKKGSLALSG